MPICAAPPTSPRCRPSGSACAATPALPRKCSARLAEKGINIEAISTSEIKISVLIDAAYAELAVRTLHSLFGLDSR
jgi:Aspartokinases